MTSMSPRNDVAAAPQDGPEGFVSYVARIVPGVPTSPSDEFDITRAGTLDYMQRESLKRIAITSFGADPLVAAKAATFGELASLCVIERRPSALFRGMDGPTVRIRPPIEKDLEPLYIASVAPESSFAWRFRGQTPTREEFRDSLGTAVLCQFAVEYTATGELIGLVAAYEPMLESGHVKIGFIRCNDAGPTGGGSLQGLILLLLYLFRGWPLRKVFFEIPSYNDWIAESTLGSIATREAELRDYLFTSNQHWSLCTYALTRESFKTAVLEVADGADCI